MLTLKVITTDKDGLQETSLFSAESISHTERIEKQSGISNYADVWILGAPPESMSEQTFVASHVLMYDDDRILKQALLILPKSDCFVMDNGKTVDTFYSYYKL